MFLSIFILVIGVKKPVFFFNHSHPEQLDEHTMSHSNRFEAEMVVGLTRLVKLVAVC